MARLSDADQSGLPLSRLDSGRAHRARSRALPGSSPTHTRAAPPGNPGVAEFLLQVPNDSPGPLSRARSFHPADEAKKHAAPFEGRRADHASGIGILRLVRCGATRVARAPSPASLRIGGKARVVNSLIVEHIGRLCIDLLGCPVNSFQITPAETLPRLRRHNRRFNIAHNPEHAF